MKDSLLDNVGKMIDGKAATVMSGVDRPAGQVGRGHPVRHPGSDGPRDARGRAVGAARLAHRRAGADMTRAAPLMPSTSVAPPSLMHGLPTSPFSQGLMGALAGRGMSSMGSRVAAKVMPRSPAGG